MVNTLGDTLVRLETKGVQTRIHEDFSQVLAILFVSQMGVFGVKGTLGSRNIELPNDEVGVTKTRPPK